MLEEMCRTVFKQACEEVIEQKDELRLKIPMRKGRPENEFKDFFTWRDGFHTWDGWLVKKVMNTRIGDPIRDAFNYFVKGEKIRDAYICMKYGTMENAMRETENFSALFYTFLADFGDRRNRFMSEMEQMIATAKQSALAMKRSKGVPQSHGGVANLLKILTKTMKEQGSSIRTIAKVQYAVCIQAGILIPDEFITDVLVAANIEKEG